MAVSFCGSAVESVLHLFKDCPVEEFSYYHLLIFEWASYTLIRFGTSFKSLWLASTWIYLPQLCTYGRVFGSNEIAFGKPELPPPHLILMVDRLHLEFHSC